MRIAQVSLLSTPVREAGSSSVEYLVWQLTEELIRMGHEVTVFAAAGSESSGELVITSPGETYGENGALDDWELAEWVNLCRAVEQSGRFDVLHSHAFLWGIPLNRVSRAPLVHTMHVQPYEDHFRLWQMDPAACVTGISRYQWKWGPYEPTAVVYHGVDPTLFSFEACPGEYVCFLGRFEDAKGPKIAIKTARSLGLPIRLAGERNEYFEAEIEPLLEGDRVAYAGYVGGAEKDRFLRGARALLYPLTEPEPFGLVQIEAMMCGTPVAAIGIGAVPEIVEEGLTGSVAAGPQEFPAAVERALTLDRRSVRARAEERFSVRRMAADYVRVYERLAGQAREGAS